MVRHYYFPSESGRWPTRSIWTCSSLCDFSSRCGNFVWRVSFFLIHILAVTNLLVARIPGCLRSCNLFQLTHRNASSNMVCVLWWIFFKKWSCQCQKIWCFLILNGLWLLVRTAHRRCFALLLIPLSCLAYKFARFLRVCSLLDWYSIFVVNCDMKFICFSRLGQTVLLSYFLAWKISLCLWIIDIQEVDENVIQLRKFQVVLDRMHYSWFAPC